MQPKCLARVALAVAFTACSAPPPCSEERCPADAQRPAPRPDAGPLGAPSLQVLPSTLAFGQVPLEQSRGLALRLSNLGAGPALELSLSVSGGGFTLDAGECPRTLGADAGCTLWLAFSPAAAQAYSGVFRAQGLDAGARANLSGQGVPPAQVEASLALSPAAADFPAVRVGEQSAPVTFTLTNQGAQPVTAQLAVGSADFLLQRDTCSGQPLAANAACTLEVRSTPTAVGATSAALLATAEDAGVAALLRGAGFALRALRLQSFPPGLGRLDAEGGLPDGGRATYSCGPTCSEELWEGSQRTVTAVPVVDGGRFLGWSGDCAGDAGRCTVDLDVDRTVLATFAQPPAPVPLNTLFVTSASFSANLGGLAGADTRCAAIAADAGLPGTFVALLGTQGAPALARLGAATGFATVDGKALAQTPEDFAQGRVRRLALTERGNPVATFDSVITVHTGVAQGAADCAGWTSASAAATGGRGSSVLAGTYWLGGFELPCDAPARLYCVTTGLTATLPRSPVPPGARRAFLTGESLSGAASLQEADALCAREGGPGALSLRSLPDGGAAAARLRAYAGPFYRPDGELLFAAGSFTAQVPFNVQADGGYAATTVWTGAAPDQLPSSALSCNHWSPGALAVGMLGSSLSPELTWANYPVSCTVEAPLYCAEP